MDRCLRMFVEGVFAGDGLQGWHVWVFRGTCACPGPLLAGTPAEGR